MKMARSAIVNATFTDCSTMSIVWPCCLSCSTTSRSSCTTRGARPRLSSSMSRISGSCIRAMPRASICCWPPERSWAVWRRLSARAGKISYTRSVRTAMSERSLVTESIVVCRFSSTLMSAKTAVPPRTCTMPCWKRSSGETKVTVRPFRRTTPRSGMPRPLTARSRVDLPAPFVPSRASVSPLGTSSPTSKSTWTGP